MPSAEPDKDPLFLPGKLQAKSFFHVCSCFFIVHMLLREQFGRQVLLPADWRRGWRAGWDVWAVKILEAWQRKMFVWLFRRGHRSLLFGSSQIIFMMCVFYWFGQICCVGDNLYVYLELRFMDGYGLCIILNQLIWLMAKTTDTNPA